MMNLEELLERLELDSPEDFEYFEHFAELMEIHEVLEYEPFYGVLSEAPKEILAELTENYFEDILQGVPDNTIDIYTLLTEIRQNLSTLAQNVENADARRLYVDELYKFKNWYTQDSLVQCTRLDDRESLETSLCEALALYRLEKLNEDRYDYDFTDCLDFDLSEYAVSLGTPAFLDQEPDPEDGPAGDEGGAPGAEKGPAHVHDHPQIHEEACDCGHDHAHHHHEHSRHLGLDPERDPMEDDTEDGYPPIDPFTDGLIDPHQPVIDGEYAEEDEEDGGTFRF